MSLQNEDKPPQSDEGKPKIKLKEPAEVVAFIDHYLALADTLLAPNVEKQPPEEKSEPYVDHRENTDQSSGPGSTNS